MLPVCWVHVLQVFLFLAEVKDNILQSVWNIMTSSTVCFSTESFIEMATASSPINLNTETHLALLKKNVNSATRGTCFDSYCSADSIYTERYMLTPQENHEGYAVIFTIERNN